MNLMKNLAITLLFSSILFATPAMAGSGHDHGHGHEQKAASSEVVLSRASKKVKQLADAGKIDPSWAEVKSSNIEQKTFSKESEWVVTFKNNKISDSSKQTLYIFFSLAGHYIAANHTGQ